MALHSILAAAPKDANLWNPTILGILTVAAAIALFCGSVYLLLATNMGARLGFLVAAAGLSLFMLLLATLWWTSGSSGIDPPHGASPSWHVVDVVDRPIESEIEDARDIQEQGEPISEEQLVNLKPAVDAALVGGTSQHGEEPEPAPFASLGFTSTTDYLVDFEGYKAFRMGGGSKNVFWHEPEFAALQLCTAQEDVTPARCDPLEGTKYVILEHDLGSLRQPVVAYWFMSLILFGLSLLGLHWWEQDERARKRASLTPVPAPGT